MNRLPFTRCKPVQILDYNAVLSMDSPHLSFAAAILQDKFPFDDLLQRFDHAPTQAAMIDDASSNAVISNPAN